METALLVVLIFLIASGLNRIDSKSFFGASIRNDSGERIETLEFEVPALRSSVLFYKAGELQSANPAISGRDFRLWYPPEEVSKKSFLESLENAIVVVGTHEASTSEHNKQIDGWPKRVFYDDVKKAAMVKGVVKGTSEAAYVRQLKSSKDFGASGFIDARQIELKPGTTPEGEQYDGIARDLFATHLALLPNVRDPKNRVETFNAVALITNAGTLKNGEDCPPQSDQNTESAGGKMAKNEDEKKPEENIENAVRNVISKMEAEKSGAARMDAMEKTLNGIAEQMKNSGKNAEGDPPPKKDDPPADTTNADDGDVLKNAKASEETIKIFADALGLNPASLKNSTVKDLAKFAGVDIADKSPIEVVQLVNAKAKELKGSETTDGATATNAESEGSQFDALLKRGA